MWNFSIKVRFGAKNGIKIEQKINKKVIKLGQEWKMFAKKKIEFYSQKKNKFSSLPKKWTKKVMIDKKK